MLLTDALRRVISENRVVTWPALRDRWVVVPASRLWQTSVVEIVLAVRCLGGKPDLMENYGWELHPTPTSAVIVPEEWANDEEILTRIYGGRFTTFIVTERELYLALKDRLR